MSKKWSKKFDKCIWCGKTGKKHCGKGLCRSCYEKKRSLTEKRIKSSSKAKKKYYLKNKDNKEYKEKRYNNLVKFRKTKKWKEYLKRRYIQDRLRRYIIHQYKKDNYKEQKGLTYICYGCNKNCKIKSNARDILELKDYKKLNIEYCKKLSTLTN